MVNPDLPADTAAIGRPIFKQNNEPISIGPIVPSTGHFVGPRY